MFTCGICLEEYHADDPAFRVKMLSCEHTFCEDCFRETFRAMIEDQNRAHQLMCPEAGCGLKPTEDEVKQILEENCFAKFKRF